MIRSTLPPAPVYTHNQDVDGHFMVTTVSPYRGPETRWRRGYIVQLHDVTDGVIAHEAVFTSPHLAAGEVFRCNGVEMPDWMGFLR